MIGVIALLFLNPPLTKMHKLVLHFFIEEDNYCCHCHIHFSVLITNELNLAHDQRSFSYPVNANSRYHTFSIDWRRKGKMDLDIIKFRICLTRRLWSPVTLRALTQCVSLQTQGERIQMTRSPGHQWVSHHQILKRS